MMNGKRKWGNLQAALDLARAGFYVFPCRDKTPAGKWRDISTRDEAKIRHMWHNKPGLVAGIDLGKSGHIVIDCDVKGVDKEGRDGRDNFALICEEHGFDLSHVGVVGTPSGGNHFYFKQREGEVRGNCEGKLPHGIDVRGDGGYTLAPLMVTGEGGEYEYQGELRDLIDAPTLPDWLANILGDPKEKALEAGDGALEAGDGALEAGDAHPIISRPIVSPTMKRGGGSLEQAFCRAAIDGELGGLAGATEGRRNQTLFNAALKIGSMVAAGWCEEAPMRAQLTAIAEAIGLKKDEITRAINNGFKTGLQNPRDLPDDIKDRDRDNDITPQEEERRREISNVIYLSFNKKQGIKEEEETRGEEETLGGEETPVEGENWEKEAVEYPEGLVGEIARWIVSTARYPQPELSIGAALGIIGTAAGRQFAGPTFSGTHLYTLAMAETGTGKDAPLQAIKTILNAADMGKNSLGPDEFASMPAVVGFIRKKPVSICPMDEFGGFMKRVMSKRGSTHENAIPKVLRSMWSSSFSTYMTPEAVMRESVAIHSPSLSIFGATTPEQFYSAMSGAQVEDGTLNRFLLIRGRDEVEEVEPQLSARKVPQSIIDGIKRIYNTAGEVTTLWRGDADVDPTLEDKVIEMAWEDEAAQARYKAFSREIFSLRKQNAAAKEFYVRTGEMAVRIATIVAIGRGSEKVGLQDLEYGIKIARRSANFMVEGAGDYMAENDNQANGLKIRRILKSHGGRMSQGNLTYALKNSIRAYDLKGLLQNMAAGEEIEIVEIKTKGRPKIEYHLKK